MITTDERRMLETECRALCEAHELPCAYVARIMGPRRHYLAGFGSAQPGGTEQMTLTENLALFWCGDLPYDARSDVKTRWSALARDVEARWAVEPTPRKGH